MSAMAHGEEHERLISMAGTWVGEEHWHPSPLHPDGHVARARANWRAALGGFALVQDYEHETRGVVTYRTHGVMRWDSTASEYVLHVVDAAGGPPQEYRGRYERDEYVLEGDGPGGRARSTMVCDGERLTIRYEVAGQGDAWVPLMEADYARHDSIRDEAERRDAARPTIGSIAWTDLTVEDAEGVRDFYEAVAGWRSEAVSMGGYSDFNMVPTGSGEAVAGICHARGGNADLPPQWMLYVVVASVDASARACVDLGGEVLVPPRPMGPGRYSVIRDPAGAVCALYRPGG